MAMFANDNVVLDGDIGTFAASMITFVCRCRRATADHRRVVVCHRATALVATSWSRRSSETVNHYKI